MIRLPSSCAQGNSATGTPGGNGIVLVEEDCDDPRVESMEFFGRLSSKKLNFSCRQRILGGTIIMTRKILHEWDRSTSLVVGARVTQHNHRRQEGQLDTASYLRSWNRPIMDNEITVLASVRLLGLANRKHCSWKEIER